MKTTYTSETDLIAGLAEGKPDAYDQLLKTYHHKLCVYAASLTQDTAVAEDLVQNVFVRIWKKRETLETSKSLRNFLYKSVYNEFIDYARYQRSFMAVEKQYMETLNQVVEEDDDALQRAIQIMKEEIEKLPAKCKEVFLLSKRDGLMNVEIAEYLEISIKTVEGHMLNAYSRLREKIGERTDGILFLLFGAPKKT